MICFLKSPCEALQNQWFWRSFADFAEISQAYEPSYSKNAFCKLKASKKPKQRTSIYWKKT